MGDEHPSPETELMRRISADIARLLSRPLEPGLYIVATPIGNLADITLRALAVLATVDEVFCEDTRHSRGLFSHFGIDARLLAYHDHNGARLRPRIIELLGDGRSIALISDAGTPLISDPGYKLVRECVAAGFNIFSIPGPSAALGALVCAGLPTDCFMFAGFLPVRGAQRRARLAELSAIPATLVFYEAPSRLFESLTDMATVLGPRPAAVVRELTKLHETVLRDSLDVLADSFAGPPPRGEIAVVVGPPIEVPVPDEAIVAALDRALATQSLRDATKVVAELLGVPKSRVYDLGLEKKRDSE